MVAPWNNTPPWLQAQPMATQPMQQVPGWQQQQWAPSGAANPTLWQQATATQPQGGTQQQGTQGWAVPTWAGGQAGPSWAAANPGAGQMTALGSTPDPMYAKTPATDLSKAPLPGQTGAASTQSLTAGVMPTIAGTNMPGYATTGGAASNQSNNGTARDRYSGTTFTMPVPFDQTRADAAWEFGGKMANENTYDRVLRQAADGAKGGNVDPQHYLEYVMANHASDFRRRDANVRWTNAADGGLGYDPNQFADNAYGEQYDPNKVYRIGGTTAAQGQATAGATAGSVPVDPSTKAPLPTGQSLDGQQTQDAAPQTSTTNGTGTNKNFGQFSTNDLASLLQAAANDPDRAAQILRLAQGQTGRPLGRMADFRDSLYGRAFQTALSTAGLDGFSDLQGTANNFLQQGVQGNNLIGYSGDLARQLAGQSFEGVNSTDMEKQLRAALALQGLNMGSMGGSVQQGRLDDLTYADWARSLADSGNDTKNFADLYNGSKFQRSIANYGR